LEEFLKNDPWSLLPNHKRREEGPNQRILPPKGSTWYPEEGREE